ncbi:MAG: hypothetical protein WKI04_19165, partial [Ferruginibacter sp.]
IPTWRNKNSTNKILYAFTCLEFYSFLATLHKTIAAYFDRPIYGWAMCTPWLFYCLFDLIPLG